MKCTRRHCRVYTERIGYITPTIWGIPKRGEKQKGTTCERIGYITPTVWCVFK